MLAISILRGPTGMKLAEDDALFLGVERTEDRRTAGMGEILSCGLRTAYDGYISWNICSEPVYPCSQHDKQGDP